MIHFITWIQLFLLGTLSTLPTAKRGTQGLVYLCQKPFTSPFFEMENKELATTQVTCVLHSKHTRLPKSVWGPGAPAGGGAVCLWVGSPAQPPPQARAPLPPLEVNRLQQMTPFGDVLVRFGRPK